LRNKVKNKEPKVAGKPKPQVLPPVETKPEPEVKTILEVVGYAQGREAGRKEGFADGIRYIVTLAEDNLAKSLKLADRHALGKSGRLPGWWVVTLVKALGTKDLPDDVALQEGL